MLHIDGLLNKSDVFVHGWTQPEARQRGFDDASIGARHPHLIAASVTSFPTNHPDSDVPNHEILVQARLGAMDEQLGYRSGPVFIRLPFANWGASFLLAGGIVARLYQRVRQGRSGPIHTSLVQGALVAASMYWQRAERAPEWMVQNTLPKVDPPGTLTIFECADGRWIQVMGRVAAAAFVVESLAELDLMHLVDAPRIDRASHTDWERVFRCRTADEWLGLLRAAEIACAPVMKVGEILLEEQAALNGFAIEVDDPVFGRTTQAGPPFVTDPPCVVRGAAPRLGQHTEQVLALARSAVMPRNRAPADPVDELPFAGIRVLDLGVYVAGPFGGQCLASLGADVVKIEPATGERGRGINQFTCCQRGKRSIAIDLRQPESRDALHRLIRSADVVTYNLRLEAAGRLGIDEASLKAINPAVVLGHVNAHGPKGPWASFPGFDPTAQALSGWEQGIAGHGNPPMSIRNSLMDPFTGLSSFVGMTLALYHRERTGHANAVAASLLGMAVTMASETLALLPSRTLVPIAELDRDQTRISPGYGIYQAADDWIAIAATDDATVAALRSLLNVDRDEDISTQIAGRACKDLLDALQRASIPSTKVMMNNRDAFFDAELQADSQLVVRTESVEFGWLDTPGALWTLPGVARRPERSIPGLGEHSRELLTELGFNQDEIGALTSSGVVSSMDSGPGFGQ